VGFPVVHILLRASGKEEANAYKGTELQFSASFASVKKNHLIMHTIENTITFTPGTEGITIHVGNHPHKKLVHTDEELVQLAVVTVLGTNTPDTQTLGKNSVLFYKPHCSVFEASLRWTDTRNGFLRITQKELIDYKIISQQLTDCIASYF
jgi:hypothetical protein